MLADQDELSDASANAMMFLIASKNTVATTFWLLEMQHSLKDTQSLINELPSQRVTQVFFNN